MEVEASDSKPSASDHRTGGRRRTDQVRVKRETLQAVLEQCRIALELIQTSGGGSDLPDENDSDDSSSQGSGGADSDTAEEVTDLIYLVFTSLID